jgi:hypothetical protein
MISTTAVVPSGITAQPALIYFRQIGKSNVIKSADGNGEFVTEGHPCYFPHNPDEAKEMVFCQMEVHGPGEPYVVRDLSVCDLRRTDAISEIYELMMVSHQPSVRNSHIFTVHAKSMLLRMYRWGLMQRYNATNLAGMFNAVSSKTIDLCEAFHYPSVLRFEERAAFGIEDITKRLGFQPSPTDPDPETTLLQMLCLRCL